MAVGYSLSISAVDNASKNIDAINKRLTSLHAPTERFNQSIAKFAKLSGLKDVAESFKAMGRGAMDAFRGISQILSPLAALTSVGTIAGVYALAEQFGELGTHLLRVSQFAAISGSSLQNWEGAAKLMHVSVEDIDGSLTGLNSALVDIAGGRGGAAQAALRSLGIEAVDPLTGKLRTATQVFMLLADAAKRLNNPTLFKQATAALNLAPGVMPMLIGGSAPIQRNLDVAASTSPMTQQMIDDAVKLTAAEDKLKLSVAGFMNQVADAASGPVTDILKLMDGWIAANRDWIATDISGYLQQFDAWLKSDSAKQFGAKVEALMADIGNIAKFIWEWRDALLAVFVLYEGARFVNMIVQVGRLGVAVAGVAASWAGVGSAATKAAAEATAAAVKTAPVAAPAAGEGLLAGVMSKLGVVGEFMARLSPWLIGAQVALTPTAAGADEDADLARMRANGTLGRGGEATTGEKRASFRASGSGFVSSPIDNAVQKANEAESFKFWRARGMTDNQAAGMVSNERAESGFNPGDVGDGGDAVGSFQWHKDRRDAIQAATGIDVATDKSHLNHLKAMAWEITHREKAAGDAIGQTRTAFEAGAAGSTELERPGDKYGQAQARGSWARDNVARLIAAANAAAAPPAMAPPATVNAVAGKNAAEQTLKGSATVTVRHVNPPPGTTVQASTTGNLFSGAPKIETSMPARAEP